jgi:hypothetical protein
VGGVKRQAFGNRSSGDHEVGGSAPRVTSGGDHRGGHLTKDPGSFGTERDGIEFVLGALEYVEAPGALGVLIIVTLLVVAADLVRSRWQLGQGELVRRHVLYGCSRRMGIGARRAPSHG